MLFLSHFKVVQLYIFKVNSMNRLMLVPFINVAQQTT